MAAIKLKAGEESFTDLHFPKAGVDVSQPFWAQPNRPLPNGEYARTTADALNVRTYEPALNRDRGGSRAGLVKWIDTPVVAGYIIQHLNTIGLVSSGSVG